MNKTSSQLLPIPAGLSGDQLTSAINDRLRRIGATPPAAPAAPVASGGGNAAAGALGIVIDGAGATPATGSKGYLSAPYSATITGWTLVADQAGSAQITVKKATYANFPATASITGSAPPNLSSARKNMSAGLTGWTTGVTAGDVLEFNLDSAATVTRLVLELQVSKS